MKITYQAYGIDGPGRVTHAGTFEAEKLTHRRIIRYQEAWERWREQYLASQPGDFPLRQDYNNPERATVAVVVHPLGKESEALRFFLA